MKNVKNSSLNKQILGPRGLRGITKEIAIKIKKAAETINAKGELLGNRSGFWINLFLIYAISAILLHVTIGILSLTVCFQIEEKMGVSLTNTLYLYNIWIIISMSAIYLFLFYIFLFVVMEIRKKIKDQEDVL